ncbi:carbohydrate-binding protein [Paenibacillus sp. YPG26]|uniref:carbohydrate-binding protein n=1 Tax=Paenibacillus sp. YPG26 TaxID=2878915 RepID=UPI00203B1F5C|nr:carbohydrate-binding protein [Paenibacillus sp. YPG26]USB32658.1 CBM21 domain-containing protein [Paenibacillus sp. YPG26]
MLKSMKKYLAGVTFLALFALTFAQSAFASEQPVQLISSNFYAYKYGYVGFSGNVEVSNLNYQKNVTIHYTPGDGKWYDTSASYVGPTDASHEKWGFSVNTSDLNQTNPQISTAQEIKFAIKYEAGGQTYWDNNNGQNYSITRFNLSSTILGKPNVLLASSSIYDNTFTGNVFVKNIAYNKTVKIVYTTDNWATTKEGYATYSRPANTEETVQDWQFSFNNIGSNVSQIKYAISYTVNGQTYWDNNYGQNYTVNR